MRTNYGQAIRDAFAYLLERYPEVIVLGQGLWSPWYVGNSMTDLDRDFGRDRVIDTPVSEQASTGAAVGAAVAGAKPIVVHPRMDFMILAVDQIVTQAAKWRSMFGGESTAPAVFRGIINRGGEQGAQHSQALHAWFAHIPGLRVVMPYTPTDARDLLISACLCEDPVLYIDDRWLYDLEEDLTDEPNVSSIFEGPRVVTAGEDVTVVSAGYSTHLAVAAAHQLRAENIKAEVIDLRSINPIEVRPLIESVSKTGRLLALDGGWTTCGLAGEIVASVSEEVPLAAWRSRPCRVTLQDAPAPTSRVLEDVYYPSAEGVVEVVRDMMGVDT